MQVNKRHEARTSTGTTILPDGDTQDEQSSSQKTSNAMNDDAAATECSLTPRQRGRRLAPHSVASKQPRLLSDAPKLIVRPRGGLLLSNITNFQPLEAGCAPANFPKASIRGKDLMQVNPIQNTFASCILAIQRAERVVPPGDRQVELGALFLRVQQLALHQPHTIVRDFKAPHSSWGYQYDSPKDCSLYDESHLLHLSLLTHPSHPTHRGREWHVTPHQISLSCGLE
ncbi:hypothetical protein HPB51_021611 [Rhipicephalus microplus]|uniref:Uncharacterized protein n=1 Tax=Rhipicephalus microplus TaxID=6941 RepID=A0A9J6ECW2_RHIMP|nr:hypothetical protein HPB51_021611 [Rhipicephalus microplus]